MRDADAEKEMAAEAVIDSYRFGTPSSETLTRQVLAQLDEPSDSGVMPDAEALKAAGGDIVVIAQALKNGLDPESFGRAICAGLDLRAFSDALRSGLDVRAFSQAVNRLRMSEFGATLSSTDIETINAGLEHLADFRVSHFDRL